VYFMDGLLITCVQAASVCVDYNNKLSGVQLSWDTYIAVQWNNLNISAYIPNDG
jgi:FKBP-type peptidyl-prolyl cis-trans isomerase 2